MIWQQFCILFSLESIESHFNSIQFQPFQQRTFESVQHSNGLHYGTNDNVELWSVRHDVDPLAGAVAIATSLFDIRCRIDGARIHQISTRSNDMGRFGCDFHLGSVPSMLCHTILHTKQSK